MSYEKKGIQWYDDMPVDLQLEYLDCITDDQLDYIYNVEFGSFADFLAESFEWNKTTQGFEYWLEVSKYNFHEVI